jgi:hypothetical protein
MGLDGVEIILRAEEFFDIAINDDAARQVQTVGDFYILICGLLNVAPSKDPVTSLSLPIVTECKKSALFFRRAVHLPSRIFLSDNPTFGRPTE